MSNAFPMQVFALKRHHGQGIHVGFLDLRELVIQGERLDQMLCLSKMNSKALERQDDGWEVKKQERGGGKKTSTNLRKEYGIRAMLYHRMYSR